MCNPMKENNFNRADFNLKADHEWHKNWNWKSRYMWCVGVMAVYMYHESWLMHDAQVCSHCKGILVALQRKCGASLHKFGSIVSITWEDEKWHPIERVLIVFNPVAPAAHECIQLSNYRIIILGFSICFMLYGGVSSNFLRDLIRER